MDTVIYHKCDKLIAGYVLSRRTEQQTQEALAAEINNICQSELGGIPEDYTLAEVESVNRPGYQTVINDDGSVGFTPIPADPRRVRIAELLPNPRSGWTTSQLRELLELCCRLLTS